ncbi:MAG: 4-hydroxybenzoate 3-monooxygenase [Geminicoccaceae bacterium]
MLVRIFLHLDAWAITLLLSTNPPGKWRKKPDPEVLPLNGHGGSTQVGIVGAGPAGLLLSQLLGRQGIESVVLERQSQAYVEARIRAGLLEQGTVDLLQQAGVGARLAKEGLTHEGIEICHHGKRHRIDLKGLSGGKVVTVYGQTEVTKDLIEANLGAERRIVFEAENVSIHDIDGDRPMIRYVKDGEAFELSCAIIAGCDGYHGVCRRSLPKDALSIFERTYPFAWLGILADTKPVSDELIYASGNDGFALFSMRSPTRSRIYLQCRPDEKLGDWPDERIWEVLRGRLDGQAAEALETGPAIEKSVTPMRSFVVEPMRFGRLFLAGDAAHIVPPTGAKGLNLAVADIGILAEALTAFFETNRTDLMDAYSATCLRRVWKVQRFSWWMTSMLHRFPDGGDFGRRMQDAELSYVTTSTAAATTLAENYVGLPFGRAAIRSAKR